MTASTRTRNARRTSFTIPPALLFQEWEAAVADRDAAYPLVTEAALAELQERVDETWAAYAAACKR